MTLTESRRIERNQRATKSRKWWCRVYRSRMKAGLEQCRVPDCTAPATVMGHIVAYCNGGPFLRHNLALLCRPCDIRQGTETWDRLESVADDPEYRQKMAQGVVS